MQRPFGGQPTHGFAGWGHRHIVVFGYAAQGQGLAGFQLSMHDPAAQGPVNPVMGGNGGVDGARGQHGGM